MDEIRELEIKLAKAVGFTVERGTLYAPKPNQTLLGGDVMVNMGAKPETPEIVSQCWQYYTPRFARNMDDAMFLLDHLHETDYLDYNLFRDNNGLHTCEVGFWSNEPGGRDETWQANEKEAALAVARAVKAYFEARAIERL